MPFSFVLMILGCFLTGLGYISIGVIKDNIAASTMLFGSAIFTVGVLITLSNSLMEFL